MLNLRKFRTYVVNRKVWKGWDYIVLPDGRGVGVPPGKYMRVDEKQMAFGFEDSTEEIGEKPDYDYDEPFCRVIDVSGFVLKTVRLACRYGGGYENHLYYGRIPVATFKPGSYETTVEFRYVDSLEASAVGAVAGGAIGGGATYAATMKPVKSSIAGIVLAIIGGVIGYCLGE